MIDNKYLRQSPWLYRQYYGKGLSTLEIAKICGCGKDTVCRWMESFGIKRRTFEDAKAIRLEKNSRGRKYQNKSWLYKKYWEQNYGMKRLADLCGVTRATVRYWIKRHNIKIRDPLEGYYLQHREANKPPYGSVLNRTALFTKDVARSFRQYF